MIIFPSFVVTNHGIRLSNISFATTNIIDSSTRFMRVNVRRQWNDFRIGETDLETLNGLHWDRISGGARARAPRPFLSAYVLCTEINGDIAHSCMHGTGPHEIKVVIVKKDNDPEVYEEVLKKFKAS